MRVEVDTENLVRFDSEKIDFDIPQLLIDECDMIVLNNSAHTKDNFTCVVLSSNFRGYHLMNASKSRYKKFTGKLILVNENKPEKRVIVERLLGETNCSDIASQLNKATSFKEEVFDIGWLNAIVKDLLKSNK